ncbi:ATP-dependent nuclease [Pseudoalteromonas gelatinilytica]
MHISKLTLRNYRNFKNSTLAFNRGINTLIGENGAGKTNVFRAIRLLLDNNLPRSASKLIEDDFCRKLASWRGHWIVISLEFSDIGMDEVSQALFIHGTAQLNDNPLKKASYNLIFRPKAHIRKRLSEIEDGDVEELLEVQNDISIADYETIFTGKSEADFSDDDVYRKIVGDFNSVSFPSQISKKDIGVPLPKIFSMPNEVSFTFVKALRDVVADFRSNRTNPLFNLLKLKSERIKDEEFEPIVEIVDELNESIESLSDVKDIKVGIKNTLSETLGDTYSPNSLSIRSGLSREAEQLFQSLKLFVDESDDDHEGTIHEMSLGGANLIYLTLKLLEFKYQRPEESIANFLLIEEPEAHIHTHIQKTLFDKIGNSETQIIYSTHSSHVSEVSNIENINILSKTSEGCAVFQPAIGLDKPQIVFVERYLDAIRSNLLFAKSVILVEGDAEEILIPTLVKKSLGLSLDELGITLVNMRSTGFENIALLFHDNRIRKKCAIITDLDKAFFSFEPNDNDNDSEARAKNKARGSEKSGKERQEKLEEFSRGNKWVSPFFAEHTFEVDFIKSSNSSYLEKTVDAVYSNPATRTKAKTELFDPDIVISGKRALTMANKLGKGWFAISLGQHIDCNVIVPEYICNAVLFAHENFTENQIYKILKYRFESLKEFVSHNRILIETWSKEGESYQAWNKYLLPIELGIHEFSPKLLDFEEAGGFYRRAEEVFFRGYTTPQ